MLDSKVANPDMSKSWPVGTPLALVECLILSKQISPRRRQGLATTVSSGHCPERGSRLPIAPEVAEVPLSPPMPCAFHSFARAFFPPCALHLHSLFFYLVAVPVKSCRSLAFFFPLFFYPHVHTFDDMRLTDQTIIPTFLSCFT